MGARAAQVLLLAHPAGHSFSPAMHGAAFAALGMDAEYRALDVPPGALAQAVARLAEPQFLGANVTVPHKEAVVPLMHELTPAARSVGAVNTIVNRAGRLVGHNTDGEGFLRALDELPLEARTAETGSAPSHGGLAGATCVVLGAGGAARAVVHALTGAGAHVHVHNRNMARAERLVADLATGGRGSVAVAQDVSALLPHTDLLVNTTSVGMSGGPEPSGLPLLTAAQLATLPATARVADLVYRPARTPLLAVASGLGLLTQNGLPMLVWQGALAFAEWTGREAPVDVMRAAAEQALATAPG